MSRYISVKWLEDNAKEYSLGYYDYDEYAVPLSALDEAPSIDIVRCKMSDLMREQMFAQWLISKTLALYMTQDDFREEVNSKVNDGYTFSINGEKMNNFEQTEWKLHMVCVDIARQFTEYYFNDFIADEAEQTEPNSSEKPNNCEDEPQTETSTNAEKIQLTDEPQTDNGIGCSRCEGRFDCYDRDMPHAVHCNNYGKVTDEPQTDCPQSAICGKPCKECGACEKECGMWDMLKTEQTERSE